MARARELTAPYRINYREHPCQRCRKVKPGNGTLCDDCWWTVCVQDLDWPPEPKAEAAGELTLFAVEDIL